MSQPNETKFERWSERRMQNEAECSNPGDLLAHIRDCYAEMDRLKRELFDGDRLRFQAERERDAAREGVVNMSNEFAVKYAAANAEIDRLTRKDG